MRHILLSAVILGGLCDLQAAEPLKPRAGDLKVGDDAPAFELKQLGAEKPTKLAYLKGKPVVLVFGSCT
jgi:cytochrome oxidase Cu insertion factor (SCO1/SenC/PrrC family)